MKKEFVSVDIHQLSPRDVGLIQQDTNQKLGATIHAAAANLAHLERLTEGGDRLAKSIREGEKIVELPVNVYNQLAELVGWELVATAEVHQAQAWDDSESVQPFFDEDFQPYYEEAPQAFPEEA